jgi:hypothetical protein
MSRRRATRARCSGEIPMSNVLTVLMLLIAVTLIVLAATVGAAT